MPTPLHDSVRIYDSGFRGQCPPEYIEQIDAMSWIRFEYPQYSSLCFHPINEGEISVQYRQKLIKCGLTAGIADMVILIPAGGYPYAVIEIKRQDRTRSRLSEAQRLHLNAAAELGAFAAVAYGADQFKKCCLEYFTAAL